MAMTFDIYSITKIVKEGLSQKLELVENALNKLDSNIEPVSIVENFVFFVNTNTSEFYRTDYRIVESAVVFSNPVRFEIENDTHKIERASKKVVKNIVEALADNDDESLSKHKAEWIELQRSKYQLESMLDIKVGASSKYLQNHRRIVSEAVDSTRNAKALIKKTNKKSLFHKLLESKEVVVNPDIIIEKSETKSRKNLLYASIVEAREKAKGLIESPVFKEYAVQLFEGGAEEINESIEMIAENYQEIFTLSISEQSELFYNLLENSGHKKKLEVVVEGILKIGKYAVSKDDIREQLVKLTNIIEANDGNFHERIKIIEDEINSRVYTSKDIVALRSIMEKILDKPSEFLAPEFVVEIRKAYTRLVQMQENNNYDDGALAAMVLMVSQFYPSALGEGVKKKKEEEVEEKEDEESDDVKSKSDELEDENAEATIYGESEACANCGSPKCLCSGLVESKEDEEEVEEKEEEEVEEAKEEPTISVADLKKEYEEMDEESDMEAYESMHKKVKAAMKSAKGKELEDLEDMEDELAMKKSKK
jgi:hypothetical protein